MHRDGWASKTTLGWAIVSFAAASCVEWQGDRDGFSEQDRAVIAAMEIKPGYVAVDPTNALLDVPLAQKLGQALFFDPALAGTLKPQIPGQVSLGPAGAVGRFGCADCHAPTGFFDDTRTSPNNVSIGIDFTTRNSPTLVNVGFYRSWAWDGRSDSLWMQAAVAHESAAATGGTRLRLARRLADKYAGAVTQLAPELDLARVVADGGTSEFDFTDGGRPSAAAARYLEDVSVVGYLAMAAYMSQLISAEAPIDRYARGDLEALGPSAKRGLKLFVGKAGCIECHRGPHFTDNGFHSVGIGQRGDQVPADDQGRFTGLTFQATNAAAVFNRCGAHSGWPCGDGGIGAPTAADRGQFRTKSLRNVARTPPYMHAGQLATLMEVVEHYDHGGDPSGFAGVRSPQIVPLGLSQGEREDLVAFLRSLDGAPVAEHLLCDPSPRDDASAHRFAACKDGGF